MAALARLQSSSCANPVLDVYTQVNGILTDVAVLSFQIWDKSTGTAVQVFPASPGTKFPVDVGTDCPAGGRLSVGRYVAAWSVPSNAPVGTYQIRWYIQLTPSVAEQVYIEEFEVLPEIVATGTEPGYVSVAEMRDEGVTTSMASDTRLAQRILIASRFVEASTRRFFYPKAMTVTLDGSGGPKLFLDDPIIAVSSVAFEESPLYPSSFSSIASETVRVYNRHLTEQLTEPDDRNNPKLELFNPGFYRSSGAALYSGAHQLVFPRGQRNVRVVGVFGYTDYDSAITSGKTPELIKHVTKLLVLRNLAPLADTSARFDALVRHRLTSERTRDQSYTIAPLGNQGGGALFTGDPEIDHVLSFYQRPPGMGAA